MALPITEKEIAEKLLRQRLVAFRYTISPHNSKQPGWRNIIGFDIKILSLEMTPDLS